MDALDVSTGEWLLPESLDLLHQNARKWHSELSFYKTELDFIQKLLDKYALSFMDGDKRAQLEQVQNKLFYYQGEILDEYIAEVKDLEKYLGRLLRDEAGYSDQDYRQWYSTFKDKVTTFSVEYRLMKNSTFKLIESAI